MNFSLCANMSGFAQSHIADLSTLLLLTLSTIVTVFTVVICSCTIVIVVNFNYRPALLNILNFSSNTSSVPTYYSFINCFFCFWSSQALEYNCMYIRVHAHSFIAVEIKMEVSGIVKGCIFYTQPLILITACFISSYALIFIM